MSNIQKAADAALVLADQFQNIIVLGEALREIGSLENAEREHREALVAARLDLAKLNEELSVAVHNVSTAKAEAARIRSEASDDDARRAMAANEEAQRIVDIAKAEAESIRTEAKMLSEQAQAARDLMLRHAREVADAAALEAENMVGKRDVAERERNTLQAEIDALRATAASILK